MNSIQTSAIAALSLCLPVSVAQSKTRNVDFGESVVILWASGGGGHGGGGGGQGGGGGGGGSSSSGGGHSSGASAHSAGAHGYSGAGYHSSFRGATAGAYRGGMAAARYPIYGAPISNRAALGTHRISSVQHPTAHHSSLNQTGMSRANRPPTAHNTSAARNTHRLTTPDGKVRTQTWSRNNPKNKARFDSQTQEKLRNWQGRTSDVVEARQRSNACHNHHHGHDWWRHHCDTIIFADWGWWGWWDGWWYPAWGYDPSSYYPYDGPIYGYDGLPPDEIIAGVQSELQRLGYYPYAPDGVLGPLTQNALNRYQRDHRLPITGTIDQTTMGSLGL
ncbi:MAG TPA: peptidoglycan-binding domain-containing protein [Chthoniobacterales bacterium]